MALGVADHASVAVDDVRHVSVLRARLFEPRREHRAGLAGRRDEWSERGIAPRFGEDRALFRKHHHRRAAGGEPSRLCRLRTRHRLGLGAVVVIARRRRHAHARRLPLPESPRAERDVQPDDRERDERRHRAPPSQRQRDPRRDARDREAHDPQAEHRCALDEKRRRHLAVRPRAERPVRRDRRRRPLPPGPQRGERRRGERWRRRPSIDETRAQHDEREGDRRCQWRRRTPRRRRARDTARASRAGRARRRRTRSSPTCRARVGPNASHSTGTGATHASGHAFGVPCARASSSALASVQRIAVIVRRLRHEREHAAPHRPSIEIGELLGTAGEASCPVQRDQSLAECPEGEPRVERRDVGREPARLAQLIEPRDPQSAGGRATAREVVGEAARAARWNEERRLEPSWLLEREGEELVARSEQPLERARRRRPWPAVRPTGRAPRARARRRVPPCRRSAGRSPSA